MYFMDIPCVSWMGMTVPDLSKIGERDKLKPKAGDEPHWQRLKAGCYVGYRPSRRGGRGTWFARTYDADKGKYARLGLGDYGSLKGNEVFDAAKKDAEAFADKVETGGIREDKIETVADACRGLLRAGKTISRWGGEEFLVIVPNVDAPGLQRVAERLRLAIADLSVAPVGQVTASLGATLLQGWDNQETVLQRADQALYRAKEQGGNRVVAAPAPIAAGTTPQKTN